MWDGCNVAADANQGPVDPLMPGACLNAFVAGNCLFILFSSISCPSLSPLRRRTVAWHGARNTGSNLSRSRKGTPKVVTLLSVFQCRAFSINVRSGSTMHHNKGFLNISRNGLGKKPRVLVDMSLHTTRENLIFEYVVQCGVKIQRSTTFTKYFLTLETKRKISFLYSTVQYNFRT